MRGHPELVEAIREVLGLAPLNLGETISRRRRLEMDRRTEARRTSTQPIDQKESA